MHSHQHGGSSPKKKTILSPLPFPPTQEMLEKVSHVCMPTGNTQIQTRNNKKKSSPPLTPHPSPPTQEMLEKLSVLGFDTAGVDQVQILKSRLTAASTLKNDYILSFENFDRYIP